MNALTLSQAKRIALVYIGDPSDTHYEYLPLQPPGRIWIGMCISISFIISKMLYICMEDLLPTAGKEKTTRCLKKKARRYKYYSVKGMMLKEISIQRTTTSHYLQFVVSLLS
ncbi:hypothetical protein AQUCO_01700348v1 [Aquilegia coerulea]|uniref:Uncharacterized protein n=1 Tax=Aquilegia coerulea TaxID=218851 RepID=A0A2G5DMH2_AQUCA|nr:hypothetical protein AQUCO_01700348v1 [Aquilegia coerulea]